MIDTDKYEGVKGSLVHIIPHEVWVTLTPAAQALIADAPLLLAEVKRLRELLSIDEGSRDEGYCVTMRLEGCEYIGTLRLYKDEEGKVIE
jgi:hypothetical protein